jgi:hypothetical protein
MYYEVQSISTHPVDPDELIIELETWHSFLSFVWGRKTRSFVGSSTVWYTYPDCKRAIGWERTLADIDYAIRMGKFKDLFIKNLTK